MELNNFDHNMELLNPNFMNDLKQKRSRDENCARSVQNGLSPEKNCGSGPDEMVLNLKLLNPNEKIIDE